MRLRAIHTFLCLACLTGCQTTESSIKWHTSPDRWSSPRRYYSTFETEYASNIRLHSVSRVEQSPDWVMSVNDAYGYAMSQPDYAKSAPWSTTINVENEKSELLAISIENHNNWGVQAKWINSKLLYISCWWGKILGSYFIIDVEQEKIIAREMIHDGTIAYQQYKQATQP